MTDKQIIIDEIEINPSDWLEPYKPIPACEIKDCNELVYCGDGILGCRIAEDGLVCDDFNNDDECCMYRQLEYYKEALKAKEQECERLRFPMQDTNYAILAKEEFEEYKKLKQTLTEIKEIAERDKEFCIKCNGNKEIDCVDCIEGGRALLAKEILQKISECEGNDE